MPVDSFSSAALRIDASRRNRHTPGAPYRKHLNVVLGNAVHKFPIRGVKGE